MRGVRAGLAAVAVAPSWCCPRRRQRCRVVRSCCLDPRRARPRWRTRPRPRWSPGTRLRRARPDVPQVGVMTVDVPAGTSFQRFAAQARPRPGRAPGGAGLPPPAPLPARTTRRSPSRTRSRRAGPRSSGTCAREGFPAAWDLSRGTGVKVGVIDSGIDSTHPELAARSSPLATRTPSRTGRRTRWATGPTSPGLPAARPTTGTGSPAPGSTARSSAGEERPLQLERRRLARRRRQPRRLGHQHELRRRR